MPRLEITGIGAVASDYVSLIVGGRVRGMAPMALYSRSEAHIREAAQRYGLQATAFMDCGAMLRPNQVNAIPVYTSCVQYPRVTRQTPEVGLRVLVEKPVGTFVDEMAEILLVLAERPELVCGVTYNRWTARAYRHAKSLVQSGELGELVRHSWIAASLYRTKAYYTLGAQRDIWQGEGSELLMTQTSYQLGPTRRICGMPVSVLTHYFIIGRPIQVENEAEPFLTYLNSAYGYFITLAHGYPDTNLLEIRGTRGRIPIRDNSEVEIIRLEEDERTLARSCPLPSE